VALVGLDPDGTPALGAVLAAILRAPGQVPALLRLALETRTALRALERALPEEASTRLLAPAALNARA